MLLGPFSSKVASSFVGSLRLFFWVQPQPPFFGGQPQQPCEIELVYDEELIRSGPWVMIWPEEKRVVVVGWGKMGKKGVGKGGLEMMRMGGGGGRIQIIP